jgi:hypothetical protein
VKVAQASSTVCHDGFTLNSEHWMGGTESENMCDMLLRIFSSHLIPRYLESIESHVHWHYKPSLLPNQQEISEIKSLQSLSRHTAECTTFPASVDLTFSLFSTETTVAKAASDCDMQQELCASV